MPKSSIVMLSNTDREMNVTGEPIRADAWYGLTDGLHTVAIYLQNFIGRIFIEATLSNEPQEDEWFPIFLNGDLPYLEFNVDDTEIEQFTIGLSPRTRGKSGVVSYTFQGNFLYLRARLDRTHIRPQPRDLSIADFTFSSPGLTNKPLDEYEISQFGVIKKILLNH